MRQRGEFHDHGLVQQAADLPARMQRLITLAGAGTREALWALQLIERKAAVARWRSGETGGSRSRHPRGTEGQC